MRTSPAESLRDTLLGEVERYLDAVAVFRALGLEPSWRPERPYEVSASGGV
jgi:hypothetical protein